MSLTNVLGVKWNAMQNRVLFQLTQHRNLIAVVELITKDYMTRVGARPAVKEAMRAEGLIK